MKANKKEQLKKQRDEARAFLVETEQDIASLRERFEQTNSKTNGGTLRNILKELEKLLNGLIVKKERDPSIYEYHYDIRKQRFRAEFSCHLIISDIETKLLAS